MSSEKKLPPLLLFSGGLDSSYQLWKAVKEHGKVYTMYADGGQGMSKIAVEQSSRNLVEAAIQKLVPEAMIFEAKTPLSKVNFSQGVSISWRQAAPWLISAMEVVDPERHGSVQIAYVMGDQIIQEKYKLIEAWNAMWAFCKQGPLVPLEFPLAMVEKFRILDELPAQIYAATWVCELPETNARTGAQPCGHCNACVTRQVEEFRYRLKKGRTLADVHAREIADWEAAEAKRIARAQEEREERRRQEAQELEKREAAAVETLPTPEDGKPQLLLKHDEGVAEIQEVELVLAS